MSCVLLDNDVLDIGNSTTLPTTPDELCLSPDAVLHYGTYDCRVAYTTAYLSESDHVDKCRYDGHELSSLLEKTRLYKGFLSTWPFWVQRSEMSLSR